MQAHHVGNALFDVFGVGDVGAVPLRNVSHFISIEQVTLGAADAACFLACAVVDLGDGGADVNALACPGIGTHHRSLAVAR